MLVEPDGITLVSFLRRAAFGPTRLLLPSRSLLDAGTDTFYVTQGKAFVSL